MIFEEPVLSLTEGAIGRIALDTETLSAIWGVFTKCKDSLENGRRLENISWRLWWKCRCERVSEEGWSDPEEWSETTDDDSDQEESPRAISGLISDKTIPSHPSHDSSPTRPLLNRAVSDGRRPQVTMKGETLQKMISGLKIDLLPPRSQLTTPPALSINSNSAPCHTSPAVSQTLPPLFANSRIASKPILKTFDSATTITSSTVRVSTLTPVTASAMSRQHSNSLKAGNSRPPTPKSPIQGRSPVQGRVGGAIPPVNVRPSVTRRATTAVIETNFLETATKVSTPFEPQSLVKGFDTTAFLPGPLAGSIAPPPTPAPVATIRLGSPPPSMKSSKKTSSNKKIFFISSPNSDSEEESPPSRSRDGNASYRSSQSLQQVMSATVPPPSNSTIPTNETNENEQWDDDSQSSSGWGSDFSGQPESSRRTPKLEVSESLFTRPTAAPVFESQLKPRPPGLLSQLFHPSLDLADDMRSGIARNRSSADVALRQTSKNSNTLHTSKSAGVLSEKLRTKSKSFLRGAPAGTEMESSSEEDSEVEDKLQDLRLDQRNRADEALIAPPQTPRSTRRSMLATELSASVRMNLLHERKTRNRVMGVQFNNITTAPVVSSAGFTTIPNPPSTSTSSADLRSRPPSRISAQPPLPTIKRRHTTGQNLNSAASFESSASESESEEDGQTERFGYPGGVHEHGW